MRETTPERIFQLFNAYQMTAALRAGIELEVFTAIAENHRTPGELARRCQSSERGLRILCDYLVVLGLLKKEGSEYRLSEDSALFLDKKSPAYLGTAIRFLNSPHVTRGFEDLTGAVREGGTVVGPEGSLEPDHPMWVEFAESMVPLVAPAAQEIADLLAERGNPGKVLDVAAGHGVFGISILKKHPQARVMAQDWANVLQVARDNARRAGVEDRYETLAGSAFEVDFGSGYDVILFTNFLHHFDPPTCESLMRKAYQALQPGGRVVTLEFVPNEDRVSPPVAAAFALMMLGTTPSGDAYTFPEYDRLFQKAGFRKSELHQLAHSPQQVILSEK